MNKDFSYKQKWESAKNDFPDHFKSDPSLQNGFVRHSYKFLRAHILGPFEDLASITKTLDETGDKEKR